MFVYYLYTLYIYISKQTNDISPLKHTIMTTLNLIEEKIEVALQAINSILPEGYYTTNTISSTDFGNSGYILVKKLCPVNYIVDVCKVRISDHYATNRFREATEIMIDHLRFNLDELIERIDRAINPDNYENAEIRTLTDHVMESNFEIGKKPYTTLSEPIFLGEVTTKKGNLAHRYSWLKEDVRYEWTKKSN